ncbi:heparin lyase I family protein [Pseudovibrio exalbescens]|uniref:heparin lyase I family protein n=1 Tax=Pseudovibrio exalbescens TaxID=197461 RepID=UPI002365BC2C|nr:heparin lyase I family protein [Pseudovibrio exalbescens]MDD7908875.1 heparin lyase I family protein [Pseudovibrio exalbescens]
MALDKSRVLHGLLAAFLLAGILGQSAEARKTPGSGEGKENEKPLMVRECAILADDFAHFPDQEVWDPGRVKPPHAFNLDNITVRQGGSSLAISISGEDQVDGEGNLKHELWVANDKRCNFGEEVWYSFSFRIEGRFWNTGSTRWVIGQWKEDSGGSPFLAQRFDNGVFHITVQHNETRELVAKSAGSFEQDFALFRNEFKQLLLLDPNYALRQANKAIASSEVASYEVAVEKYKEAIATQDVTKFPFLNDKAQFKNDPGIHIELSDNPFLPDPTEGWVDMRYRIKGSREGQGIIEIWANDRFIARVTGFIGNNEFAGPTQYFKFGHYRDPDRHDFKAVLHFDRFRRGHSREDVD